mgnify:CR=1 FL=1
MPDENPLLRLLPGKVSERVYDDALASTSKHVGEALADIAGTLRWFTAPFHLANAYRDRFFRYLDEVVNRVPEERRQQVRPEIAGPIFENLKYVDESSHLKEMYMQLLTRAVDSQEQKHAHPAFPHIIAQLSRDEAVLLWLSRSWTEAFMDKRDAASHDRADNDDAELQEVPVSLFDYPDNLHAYADHLEMLGLVSDRKWGSALDSALYLQAMRKHLFLTNFGYLFAVACIPNGGFNAAE